MSRTISPGLPFIGCCASSDRSGLLNDNRQQLRSHACTHKRARARHRTAGKQTRSPPACSASPLAFLFFLFGKEDKYPHNGTSLPLMHFQQSTASMHVFTYKSEFISCPLRSDLFWMLNEKISAAIVAIF